ncbi:glycosyltransferase family 4 protein [Candidatus Parcubacteria bacterium]|nr:glycosyltransferase family 4 protein [Candidatus Parcubacteria bacterium]
MKLLIITQKVDINDDVLGFMHGWIEEFAKQFEFITVICLYQGECDLPDNVKVLSLGKECYAFGSPATNGAHTNNAKNDKYRFKKLRYVWRFYKYIWQERKNYDKVFVHMNTEYIVLGGLFWRMFGKKIVLWYAHGHVPFSLKIAEKLTDIIFTSTDSGCRLKSKKIKVVGQGIDITRFQTPPSSADRGWVSDFPATKQVWRGAGRFQKNNNMFRIITVGRISPIKDYETLINAVEILAEDNIELKVDIIGDAGLFEQKEYLANLKNLVKEKRLDNVVNFVGAIPNKDIASYLKSADIFVNMSHTGSLDKAILEAMACGLSVLTCNEALENVLGKYKEMLMYAKGDYKDLAKKIKFLLDADKHEREKIGEYLRDIVIKDHNLEKLIKKIIELF